MGGRRSEKWNKKLKFTIHAHMINVRYNMNDNAHNAHGKNGRHVTVRANFFEIKHDSDILIYHYNITVSPKTPRHINRIVFTELSKLLGNKKDTVVYNGHKDIFSTRPLEILPMSTDIDTLLEGTKTTPSSDLEFTIQVAVDHPSAVKQTFYITLSPRTPFKLNSGATSEYESESESVCRTRFALDTITRSLPSSRFMSIGKHFFTPKTTKNLGYGAECWMGFYQNVHLSAQKTLLNIDISAKAFYEPSSLLAFLTRFMFKRNQSDITQPLKTHELEKLETVLVGLRVSLNHLENKYCRYKIKGLTQTPVSETSFKYKSGYDEDATTSHEINVQHYFFKKYNVILQFPFLPCIVVGSLQNPMYIPFELCDIVSGQKYSQKLNEHQTSSMIRLTCQHPSVRSTNISNAVHQLGFGDPKSLGHFNITVDDQMLKVPARILQPPTLQYNTTSRENLVTPSNGTWNLRDKKILQSCHLSSWAIVSFTDQYEMPKDKLGFFTNELINTFSISGLNIANRNPVVLYANPQTDITETFDYVHNVFAQSGQSPPQLILFILQNTSAQFYAQVKRIGDTVFGVATQCVQLKNALQPKKQFYANLCMKINVKLGGINTLLSTTPSHNHNNRKNILYSDTPTMILGADICHAIHKDASFTESICSLVGSIDKSMTRFTSSTTLQSPGANHIEHLSTMMTKVLKSFQTVNKGTLPSRIVFYRNGISENHAEQTREIEIGLLKESCRQFSPDYSPKITFVLVHRHHHVRLFTEFSGKYDNISAGTVIDADITKPGQFDFYLCSHAGLQGTSRPSYYQVVLNENDFSADLLQEFTYHLCYTYSRCTRSISVVPPVYYANLVANRTKHYLKNSTSENAEAYMSYPHIHQKLQNTMYFI